MAVAMDDRACSAAYLLAAATGGHIYVPQETGHVGSIGILYQIAEQSRFDQKLGITYHVISRGQRKADFHPHAPVSDAARKPLRLRQTGSMNIWRALWQHTAGLPQLPFVSWSPGFSMPKRQ